MATQTDPAGAQGAAAGTTEYSASLLDQAIAATKQTETSVTKDLLKNLIDEALKGTVRFDKNVSATFNQAIAAIDEQISTQLNQILHHPKFQKLEGSWRGLYYLVDNTETSANLKIRMLQLSKRELTRDLSKSGGEFDQSQLFKKIYEEEFGSPGGTPYGALIGDYEFGSSGEDIDTLRYVSGVAAAAFAPFISAAAPQLLGLNSFTELSVPRDMEKSFESTEFVRWRGFRDTEDARFVSLVLPRVLSRLPYGSKTKPVEEFNYEEAPIDDVTLKARRMNHDEFTWMNAAYVMGARLTDAFSKTGWCTGIRGAEGGGKVENLPAYIFTSDDGDADMQCPTEIGITDRREHELSNLGFISLGHYKNTDYAVFFGGQTVQKPKKYTTADATANAAISARLPYIMATSRFAHYLKMMARDKIGSYMEAKNAEDWLNRWIRTYVNADDQASAEMKLRYPLRDAKVEVVEVAGAPGSYNAVAHLRPWLQMEELTTALSLVARLPVKGN
jgi:type VI secretion system protein ImpC